MWRWLAVLLALAVGTVVLWRLANPRSEWPLIGKSAEQKAREVDLCQLKYGIKNIRTCLLAEYRWRDSTDAYVAQMRKENEAYGGP